ncbi:MAG TPA: hypothetical protein VLG38_00830 [Gammaproteobacteria bacterium]|nr:hypothetical protein [Gammaproteobacteria bacterium]
MSVMLAAIAITLLFCNWMFVKFIATNARSRTTAERLIHTDHTFASYSSDELDLRLPLYTETHGLACVNVIRKPNTMHYAPYFGWNTQQLDLDCAKQHFAKQGTKILYFGGSAMENFEAPNYLTKIDHYVTTLNPTVVSLNLAESGGRSTNNMMRIMIEGIDLPSDYWIFLDGYNEFNSIKFNGNYKDDFYWTASVSDRIHHPIKFLFDKLIAKSKLTEKLFYGTGLVKNSRVRRTSISDEEINAAADYYVQNFKKINILCEAKKVQCVFLLQAYERSADPWSTRILDIGYARILQQLGDKVIDLRPRFADHTDAFVDDVHYNKKGSELVATAIAEQISK